MAKRSQYDDQILNLLLENDMNELDDELNGDVDERIDNECKNVENRVIQITAAKIKE